VARWRAIVFDLDDTLYPERQYVLSGMRAVAAWAQDELGLPAERSFAELRQLFEDGVRGDTFDRWLAGYGRKSADRIAAMVQVFRGHDPNIALYPGARELLGRLRLSYRLGLITDGYLRVQQRKVAALDLARHFHAIVYSDTLGRDFWKPSPRPFELVLKRLSMPASEAVYVADNPTKDFRGARRVGMGTIRIRHPDGLYCQLEPTSADHASQVEITGFRDLEALLTEVHQGSSWPGLPGHCFCSAGAKHETP